MRHALFATLLLTAVGAWAADPPPQREVTHEGEHAEPDHVGNDDIHGEVAPDHEDPVAEIGEPVR